MEELSEKNEALNLYMDLYEKSKAKKENPVISTSIETKRVKPNFAEIGDKIRRDSQEALRKAEAYLDSLQKQKGFGKKIPAYELGKARNERDSILKTIEHEPILTEYKELRAEIEWNEAILDELKGRKIELQAETDKRTREIALLEKHIFKKAKIGEC